MANHEQLDILKQGVEAWNKWRVENPRVHINLSAADLHNADLHGADLSWATLTAATLTTATLYNVDFRYADIDGADLNGADLDGADLRGADLTGADLSEADLSNADFNAVIVGSTRFGNVDLSVAKNLKTVVHYGPSTIGIDTIYLSQGNIPEGFLKGAGVPDSFLDYMRSLVGKPIDYYSCFISYSSKDQAFAERLHADLQNKGVRCWFDQEDMKIGDKIRPRIEETIRKYDKLLLVLSEHSIASNWVAYEVERALNKEPQGIPNVLFPIRLDDAVMKSNAGWADDIKSTRHIGDFTHWENHDDYEKAFSRLLRDLKAEA